MEKIRRFAQAVLIIGVFLGAGAWGITPQAFPGSARAAAQNPSSKYIWWLMTWQTQDVRCKITVEHAGTPNLQEVATKCGQELTYEWMNTPACNVGKGGVSSTADCSGLYLHLIQTADQPASSGQAASTSNPRSSQPANVGNPTARNSSTNNRPSLLNTTFAQTLTPAVDTCALIWQAFPPESLPTWLTTPTSGQLLTSDQDYYYLAGRLIYHGVVDASGCPSGGLQGNGYANECGLQVAQPQMIFWQNQFDPEIIDVSLALGIPAQMLKNLFAQESQFWPGTFRYKYEYGLGQVTDNGVDVLFMWNPLFYQAYCPLVLSGETCAEGYNKLSAENRALLRGSLASQANADCTSCATGIDLQKAEESVSLFANIIIANCTQVSEIVTNLTDLVPGSIASYEDLWKLTIANYHAGAGCMTFAMNKTWEEARNLTWADVSERLPSACSNVRTYVKNISQ